jgi:2',3'-cyclic-nucleotide 2'-phosphodiesterase (5'-nucleotidase family)
MTRFKGIIFISFLLFLNISCQNSSKEFTFEGQTILLDSNNVSVPDSVQESIIMEYRSSLEEDMNRILVYSEHVMEKNSPEGLLNNFVADLVFNIGQELYKAEDEKPIDFCLLNYGGLRVPLPQGEITYSRVFELLPFENEMVVITLSGQKTLELFNYLASASVGMPVSGIKLTIENNSPKTILVQNQKFDVNRNYKILTSDYLAGGGDSMNFFLQPINYELLGTRVRDAIIQHMEEVHSKGKKISASLDKRIEIINS